MLFQPDDLNQLNVIHITGTKGKGSASAFTDSILRNAMPAWKVGKGFLILAFDVSEAFLSGLYTSPHMVAVRERIRIGGVPISEEQFATFFFDVWDRLEASDQVRKTHFWEGSVLI